MGPPQTRKCMTPVVTKAEYTEKLQRLLDDANKRFQKMELEQMRKGEVEARAILARAQEDVAKKRDALESQLKKVRKAGDSSWEKLKDGLDDAWGEFHDALEDAEAEFNGELEEEKEKEPAGAGA